MKMLKMTKERWAQIGITIQFLALVRTLSEFVRLGYIHDGGFSVMPFVIAALAAALFCWIAVTFFFFRRYTISVYVSAAAVVTLFVYKVYAIGW